MSRSGSLWCTAVLALLLALSWSDAMALDASDESQSANPSGAPADYQSLPVAVPATPMGLDDMLQPLRESTPVAVLSADASDLAALPPAEAAPVALWQRLTDLAPLQRSNAVIEIELGANASLADRRAAALVPELWNAGRHDEAIASLRSFEEAGGRCALGIAWKPGTGPAALSGSAGALSGGGDVRIGGTRTRGRMTSLDFDAQTGNLFAVVGWGPTTGGAAYWTTNLSDDGVTWTETYAWYAGATAGLIDMSAAVVGDYLYVGYVPGDYASEYRVRRCLVSNGTSDAAYGYQTILDAGTATFAEVAVVTNAESFDNRVYCFAIQSDHALRYAWDVASDGTTFTEYSPAVANASFGLDATWNPGYSSRFLYMSYAGTDGNVHVQWQSASGWTDVSIASASGVEHRTSISAYSNNIICAFEWDYTNGRGIRYEISYNAGDTWNYGDLAVPDGATVSTYGTPDVDARDGHGTAVIYSAEVGEPDVVYYDVRSGFAPGGWLGPLAFNDFDVTTGSRLTLAHLPGLNPSSFSHGAIYFDDGVPYFDFPGLGVVDVPALESPAGLQLFPAAPSPFADRATIRFTLPAAGHARLQVFNVLGRLVATLADGPMEAGTHSLSLEGRGLGSGVYFCRLVSGTARQVSRFVVIH